MADFVKARQEYEEQQIKILARTTYNAGVVAASGFGGKLLQFDRMYNFKSVAKPQTPQQIAAGLLLWAERANAEHRKEKIRMEGDANAK
jgi:hypothetical protein|nr:MAG TPA: hypothetical protein [Caudoviricetes sp.]